MVAQKNRKIDEAIRYQERAANLGDNSPFPQTWIRLRDLYIAAGKAKEASAANAKAQAKMISKATNPFPGNGASGVPLDITLEWSPIPTAEKYDVYLWRSSEPFPRSPLGNHITTARFTPGIRLIPGTKYNWMVKAFGRTGRVAGDTWTFRTADVPLEKQ